MADICINMDIESDLNDDTGNNEDTNEKMILIMIQKRERVPLQTLLTHFVFSGKMSKSTIHRHLARLKKDGEVITLKKGRIVYYALPGTSIPDVGPPSDLDRFLIEEMKKLVSEMIQSGLVWIDEETEEASPNDIAKYAEGDRRMASRYELAQKAYSLYRAMRFIRERRTYKTPIPRPYRRDEWDEEDWDIISEWTNCRNLMGSDMLVNWMDYYIEIIDFLTRQLSPHNMSYESKKKRRSV